MASSQFNKTPSASTDEYKSATPSPFSSAAFSTSSTPAMLSSLGSLEVKNNNKPIEIDAFNQLPEDLLRKNGPLFGYFDSPTKATLAKAKWFKDESDYQPSVAECAEFLLYVVQGEMKEVKTMLDKNPFLVLYKGQVIDYSGRTIEGTAYQMALGAEDVSRKNHPDEGMAEMIRGYFEEAVDGDVKAANEEIQKQQEEQFPGGHDNYEKSVEVKAQKAKDSEALKAVIDAIEKADVKFKNGKYNEDKDGIIVDGCKKALEAFREYLKPKAVITKGKHFNMELLIEALKLYDEKFYQLCDDWESPKNVLFWCQMIGYIQRYLPACYAQAFCQGLYYVVDRDEKLTRSLKFRFDEAYFFSLVANSRFQLGYEFAVWRDALGNCEGLASLAARWEASLAKLLSSKNISLSRIYATTACRQSDEVSVHNNVVRREPVSVTAHPSPSPNRKKHSGRRE